MFYETSIAYSFPAALTAPGAPRLWRGCHKLLNQRHTFITSCGLAGLVVFAGASLTEPFQEIATTYHATHSHVTITYNFAAGPALLQQLRSGASADVLALADPMTMKKAQDAGLVNTAQMFAKDTLVVILPSSNPAKITTLKDLAKNGVKISVEIPNAPAEMATRKVLANMAESLAYGTSYQSAANKNIVSQEETVKGVVLPS